MALSNRDRIGRGLEVLRTGLTPFVERELRARLGGRWQDAVERNSRHEIRKKNGQIEWDTPALVGAMLGQWEEVFRYTLSPAHRSLVHEVRDARNEWAHERPFSTDATYRALDRMKLLLEAVAAAEQAEEIERQAMDVLRTKFTEQARTESRRVGVAEGKPLSGLPPWRDVITPHEDVAAGRYEQAEFTADLAQVHRGGGSSEYADPKEFFRRTFLTEGLSHLLTNALRRLSEDSPGGDPVVDLQTNFGGGKTHSMLALYHLFSGTRAQDLFGVEPLLQNAETSFVVKANRAVLSGIALETASSETKPDGTTVRTIWGEMAHQLGGAEGYEMVREADQSGTSPGGNTLTRLFSEFAPCLILIDEWVAYLRNTYGVSGLPAGSFDANLTFAQALTEAAKATPQTLVVATLPASEIEVGGEGGREALARLQQTFSRVESTWKPATTEEGFEIVRRRLFREDTENAAARDLVVRRFSEMYRERAGSFPSGCGEGDYRRMMAASYPVHPELFERLNNDWASLEKFQKTRGVLRLMAAVIHALWEGGDRNLLIMPSTVPVENGRVGFELTRYMEDQWSAVISKDVDGPQSLPRRLDQENPNLGALSAARRAARTIYMGSAPTAGAANPGIEERSILLGCVQPGENPPVFEDALRRLSGDATYLYEENRRYWYSTQASVARMARDRAEQLGEDEVHAEITRRLGAEAAPRRRGDFSGVHAAPETSADVPDEMAARLVILGPAHDHRGREKDSTAMREAQRIFANRGQSPRIYKNTLLFLAADRARLAELQGAVARYLAWSSVEAEAEELNLAPRAVRQARSRREDAESAVASQLSECWNWCLVSEQPEKLGEVEWTEIRTGGSSADPLAARASRKLKESESLMPLLGGSRLKMALDDYDLWQGADHIPVRKLFEYLCSYVYLPRLKDSDVLLEAIREGISIAGDEGVAYADAYDEQTRRYTGLRAKMESGAAGGTVLLDSRSVLVKPQAARAQIEADKAEKEEQERERDGGGPRPGGDGGTGPGSPGSDSDGGDESGIVDPPPPPVLPNRYYASVALDPDRVGRDAGKIAEEVLSHLSALPRARLKVTLEIEAEMPEGANEHTRRTVSENANNLKFGQHGFGRE